MLLAKRRHFLLFGFLGLTLLLCSLALQWKPDRNFPLAARETLEESALLPSVEPYFLDTIDKDDKLAMQLCFQRTQGNVLLPDWPPLPLRVNQEKNDPSRNAQPKRLANRKPPTRFRMILNGPNDAYDRFSVVSHEIDLDRKHCKRVAPEAAPSVPTRDDIEYSYEVCNATLYQLLSLRNSTTGELPDDDKGAGTAWQMNTTKGTRTIHSLRRYIRSSPFDDIQLYYLFGAIPFAGHSLELLMDSLGSLLVTLRRSLHRQCATTTPITSVHTTTSAIPQTNNNEQSVHTAVIVVYGNPRDAGMPIVAEHLQLLRELFDHQKLAIRGCLSTITLRLQELPYFSPWIIPLHVPPSNLQRDDDRTETAADVQFYTPYLETTPCQSVASSILHQRTTLFGHRPSLRASLPAPSPVVIIIKSDPSSSHHTKRFFTVLKDDVASHHPPHGVQRPSLPLYPETLPKAARMWLLANAELIIDSSGANMEINRLLMPRYPSTSSGGLRTTISQRCWLTFVHPLAEPFMQNKCNTTEIVSSNLRHRFICPPSHTLHTSDFPLTTAACDAL